MKEEEKEVQALDISEANDHSDYNSRDCHKFENDLEDAKKYFLACLLMDIDLKYNLRLKRNIFGSFEKYHQKSMDLLKTFNHKKTSLQEELEDKEDEVEIL